MKSVTVTEVPDEAQLIDVREPDEYAAGHAQHAINIPMSEFAQRVVRWTPTVTCTSFAYLVAVQPESANTWTPTTSHASMSRVEPLHGRPLGFRCRSLWSTDL